MTRQNDIRAGIGGTFTDVALQPSSPRKASGGIAMRSENGFEQYGLNLKPPRPLVACRDRFTRNERMDPEDGMPLALDRDEVVARVGRICS